MDLTVLNSYVADKRLKVQVHPTEDLYIWNYSEIVQVKKLWDDITEQCRGLITDSTGNIVGRSFRKFFNDNERPYTATPDFNVYGKLDGSLGILFFYNDKWIIASRGSFASIQAETAMTILTERYPAFCQELDRTLSYSFEIIYPENRIVVNYGNERKLVFLAAFDTMSGVEVMCSAGSPLYAHMAKHGMEVVREHEANGAAIADLKARNTVNEEGYVVRFSNGLRIKIKFENYMKVHRVARNVNATMLLQEYAAGRTLIELLEQLPDEFMQWAETTYSQIDMCYKQLESHITTLYVDAVKGTATRGDFARKVNTSTHRTALFRLYDGKSIRDYVTKLIDLEQMSKQDGDTAPPGGSGMKSGVARGPTACLFILYGIFGSGKSNFAKQWLASHRNTVIIDHDSIAAGLFATAGELTGEQRKLVTALCDKLIHTALLRRTSVIVDCASDGRGLSMDHVRHLVQAVPVGCTVQVKVFDISASECEKRLCKAGTPFDAANLARQEKQFQAHRNEVAAVVAQ